MTASGFGEGMVRHNYINELIEKAPPVVSTDAQLMLLDAYETTFGIENHEHPQKARPLLLVAQQWSEDTGKGSHLFERQQQYYDCGILKFFGIPYDRWLEQPTEIVEEQMRRGKIWGTAENAQAETLRLKLEALKNGNGQGKLGV